jgi:hypothetical protein
MDVVDAPFGALIHQDGADFELRWDKGRVYCFARQYENGSFTEKWVFEDFGTKQDAQREYPFIREKFDRVCK